ncbi:MAG: DMT family transporter [Bacteroidaceae bacterium]|nr:DMT family transporter [Bacteroidaceae bacterium]
MKDTKNLLAHMSMFLACAIWGLMAPLGKDAMVNGISGIDMVTFRVCGAALCFWVTSLFTKREEVAPHDMLLFFFAGMLSIVFNQCCYTIGLSLTAPTNASIITTTMPIITMLLAAIFMKEPITGKKVAGVALGVVGALMLINGSAQAVSDKNGNLLGDVLCLAAQTCFAIYLTIFGKLIARYSAITCMKWMFTFASLAIVPFSYQSVMSIPFAEIAAKTWVETFFVVFCATYVAYILMMNGQKNLRPTIVSTYNYVQPTVACVVSVAVGQSLFGLDKAIAMVLVFSGVWFVTKSKSRKQLEAEMKTQKPVSDGNE